MALNRISQKAGQHTPCLRLTPAKSQLAHILTPAVVPYCVFSQQAEKKKIQHTKNKNKLIH